VETNPCVADGSKDPPRRWGTGRPHLRSGCRAFRVPSRRPVQ
jgi:hypothetical protein